MSEKVYKLLPEVKDFKVPMPYFPTPMQAFIFRNWEMVSANRLAKVLKTTAKNVSKAAKDLGLCEQKNVDTWFEKGYITILRSNWHILPYEQIMELLDLDEKKLAYILKEEDFLSTKFGNIKPRCARVEYVELTPEQKEATIKIRSIIENIDKNQKALPFEFFKGRKQDPIEKKKRPADCDVVITDDFCIENLTADETVDLFISRFKKALLDDFGVKLRGSGAKKITVSFVKSNNGSEYHEIETGSDLIQIRAVDAPGVLRAFTYIEDKARAKGGLYFKSGCVKRRPRFESRYIYSYSGLYGNVFDVASQVSFPDELLYEYSKVGINGIWAQAILYTLTPFPFDLTYSDGYEKRLNNLKELAARAKKFGIKVYLYLNEPRGMSGAFFKDHPEIRGHKNHKVDEYAMCTSTKEVRDYLYNAVHTLCENVPELGGLFIISRSENITNCYSHSTSQTIECPRCKQRKDYEVVSEVINIIEKAAHSVNPSIKIFAWAWAWSTAGFDYEKCIQLVNKNAIIMNVSENGKDYVIGGIHGAVNDYSMSIIGPSDFTRHIWNIAKQSGHRIAAKVQINNTWECSTVPYIPVFDNVKKHMQNLINEGVGDIMLSWTLGGWPSPNIKIASQYFFEDIGEDNDKLSVSESLYGQYSDIVDDMTNTLSKAFKEFPFHIQTVYQGPQNAGVSNPLYLQKTGLKSTMTCFAFDSLERWRSIYPEQVFKNQFEKLCDIWAKGLEKAKALPQCELKDMAYACYYIFYSSLCQIKFIMARDRGDRQAMRELAKCELDTAKEFYPLMMRHPQIGFEAANHYYYNSTMILEKMINCQYILDCLDKKL